MRTVLEICAFSATLLLPILPNKAAELLDKLDNRLQNFANAYMDGALSNDRWKEFVSRRARFSGFNALPAGVPDFVHEVFLQYQLGILPKY